MKKNKLLLLAALCAVGTFAGPHPAMAAAGETSKSLFDLYREGGPIMHLIALCSVAALALATFCGIVYRKGRMLPARAVTQLNDFMARRDLAKAYQFCQGDPG